MIVLNRLLVLILLLIGTVFSISAQDLSKREQEELAYHLFGQGDYVEAYPLFDQLATKTLRISITNSV